MLQLWTCILSSFPARKLLFNGILMMKLVVYANMVTVTRNYEHTLLSYLNEVPCNKVALCMKGFSSFPVRKLFVNGTCILMMKLVVYANMVTVTHNYEHTLLSSLNEVPCICCNYEHASLVVSQQENCFNFNGILKIGSLCKYGHCYSVPLTKFHAFAKIMNMHPLVSCSPCNRQCVYMFTCACYCYIAFFPGEGLGERLCYRYVSR